MKKRKKLLVGNWKMNPETLDEARHIASVIRRGMKKVSNVNVIICPPFPFLAVLRPKDKNVFLGAQDVFWERAGSYTGEVGLPMLDDVGARSVIIGHSERRAQGETDEMINKKVKVALVGGMGVILCIGEKERDANGHFLATIKQQLVSALLKVDKKNASNLIVAYEPIWAIGKSDREAMKGDSIHEMNIYIKKILSEIFGQDIGRAIPVLYGGSVTPANAEDIVKNGRVDGLLVGRQSLKPAEFIDIAKIIGNI